MKKKILLVKITSMGDLIQMLPAITDAANAIPGIQFDWLCEESFQDIPSLHPAINKVIVLAYRRWKKNLKQAFLSGEIRHFLQNLRSESYDMVIDAQSNIKSSLFAVLAKGRRYGLDKASVRERGAQLLYHESISIARDNNHAERMRDLMAQFLNYPRPQTAADYGIIAEKLPSLNVSLPDKFIFITAIASTAHKLWPEAHWQQVIDALIAKGYEIVMPWWSDVEKARVERLKNKHPALHLLPPLSLHEKAAVLSRATAAISLDTGLAHMAAALNIPNLTLYGPNAYHFCGTLGFKQGHLMADKPGCVPCHHSRCVYINHGATYAPCLENIGADEVLKRFEELILA